MPGLQFTRDLAEAVIRGDKTQTLRAKLPPGVVVGARLTMMNGYRLGSVFGHAITLLVDQIAMQRLTSMDARRDGFATLAELVARLESMRAPPLLWRIQWRDFLVTSNGNALIRGRP